MIRYIVIIFLILTIQNYTVAQYTIGYPCNIYNFYPNISALGTGVVSSGYDNPSNAIDGVIDNDNYTSTLLEMRAFYEIKFEQTTYFDSIQFFNASNSSNGMEDYYIFISNEPFDTLTFGDIINSTSINSIHINMATSNGDGFHLGFIGKYLRVQNADYGYVKLGELKVFGYQEKCFDGIDNDCDGLIDCNDNDCKPELINLQIINPSCPICNDGKICIQADNVRKVSIDGGSTWHQYTQGVIKCFENLPEGNYNVKLGNNNDSCQVIDSLFAMLADSNGHEGPCLNGGFEKGNFTGWTGATGHVKLPNAFNNFNLTQNEKTKILTTKNFVDPYIKDFPIDSNMGNYILRLGETNPADKNVKQKVKYCFLVDEENKDFCFRYAAILQAPPGHVGEQNAYFKYTIYDKLTGDTIDYFRLFADTNEYLSPVPGEDTLKYMGWTCSCIDLSASLNQEVCIEFETGACEFAAHTAYAYIDGLCEPRENLCPKFEINIPAQAICINQSEIPITINGLNFNKFKWEISKLDSLGQEYTNVETDTIIGYTAEMDLHNLYEELSGEPLDCPNKIKVKFQAENACCVVTKDTIFDIICSSENIEYCDTYVFCDFNNNNPPTISGTNDCDSCIISWTPIRYFTNPTHKFPSLNLNRFARPINTSYHVNIKTPSGCDYNKDVNIYFADEFELNFEKELEEVGCFLELSYSFKVPFDLTNNTSYRLIAIDTATLDTLIFSYKSELSNLRKKYFSILIEREVSRYLKIEVDILDKYAFYGVKNPNDCITDNNCIFETHNYNIIACNVVYNSQWYGWAANGFSPNNDGVNDKWLCHLVSPLNNLSCDSIVPYSSIYKYHILIFDRLGEKVFDESYQIPLNSTNPISGEEIQWDGTYNGVPLGPDDYAFHVTFYSSHTGDFNCDTERSFTCNQQGYFCYQGLISTTQGNIQLTR